MSSDWSPEFHELFNDNKPEDTQIALIDMENTPLIVNCMISAGASVNNDGTEEPIILLQFLGEERDTIDLIEMIVPVSSPLGVALVSGAFTDRVLDRLKEDG